MFSKVAICKVCIRRVLDEQLYTHIPQSCIYCLKEHLEKEVDLLTKKRQDYLFALQIMDHNHLELNAAYEAAIADIDIKAAEINQLRNEVDAYKAHVSFKLSLDELMND